MKKQKMNTEELQLLVQEKDEAVERYNQSQLLIERLEDELKNLKELSPNSEKHFFNMLQKEYVQIIDTMREKMKAVQEKLNDELKSNNRKDNEIRNLNEKLAESSRRFRDNENEIHSLRQLLKQEQERKLCLESELITSEKKSYYLQNKYQYISDIEEERDKLHHENVILSKDCNELEFALEVCHQKIDRYETELQKMNEDLKLLIEEKVSITRRNTDFRDEVTELKDVILNLSSECNKVNKETENLLSEKGEQSISSPTKAVVGSKMNFFDEACGSVVELCKSVNRLKRITNEYSKRNQELQTELSACHAHVKKYRNRILKMNNIISFLKQNLITLQKKLKITTNRWQHETSEIILKMENRIQELNEKYEEVKQENSMIKKQWSKQRVTSASEVNRV